MIIAVNCRLLLKNRLEGIGWFTHETLQRITRQHPEHQFVFIFDRPFDPSFIYSDNVFPVVLRPATRHPLLWVWWFEFRIPRLLRRIKADLFFSPDGYLSLRSRVPAIPVIHDINFAHRPKDLPRWPRWYYNNFFPLFARKAYRICTVSRYSMKDIAQTYGVARALIHVVHNGAHAQYAPLDEDVKQEVREQYSGGVPYFVFVGSMHPRKNLDNLLAAYARFRKESPVDVRMVVVGERMWGKFRGLKPPGIDMLKPQGIDMLKPQGMDMLKPKGMEMLKPQGMDMLKAQGIDMLKPQGIEPMQQCGEIHCRGLKSPAMEDDSRVYFTGRLEPDELRRVMGAAMALTFVPWFEGFGIPVVEAMQAGVPVLTSNVTSLPEVGGKAVLYANPGSPEEIASQMLRLSSDENLRNELIEKGLAQARKFSWDKTAKKVWGTLDTFIKGQAMGERKDETR